MNERGENHNDASLISGFDDAYVWPWIVHLFSGQQSSLIREPRGISHTQSTLNSQSKELIEEVAEWLKITIKWIEIELPNNLPLSHHFTSMTYARLVLADELTAPFTWLDVDTLLLPGWDTLCQLPDLPPGCISSATPESYGDSWPHSDLNEAYRRAGAGYFNAGVMRIDPFAWRARGMNDEWLKLIDEYDLRHFQFVDQDILNFMLVGANEALSNQFNFMPHFWKDHSVRPFIVHYASGNKPWLVPSIERRPIFHRLTRRMHSEWFVAYWQMEEELLRCASSHSDSLAQKLHDLRESTRKPNVLSLKRIFLVTRRKFFQRQL